MNRALTAEVAKVMREQGRNERAKEIFFAHFVVSLRSFAVRNFDALRVKDL